MRAERGGNRYTKRAWEGGVKKTKTSVGTCQSPWAGPDAMLKDNQLSKYVMY